MLLDSRVHPMEDSQCTRCQQPLRKFVAAETVMCQDCWDILTARHHREIFGPIVAAIHSRGGWRQWGFYRAVDLSIWIDFHLKPWLAGVKYT
jgi:hypothetical protein